MSSDKETIYYMELRAGDAVQDGDQFRDVDGQWKPYTFLAHMGGKVGFGVTARRPIPATGQVTYEEVPGSRTTQQAIDQPQRERIAYEDLQQGDIIQEGDEWQTESGRWKPFASLNGSQVQVRHSQRTRRPHNITALQNERDELQTALRECRAAHQVTMTQGLAACKERDEALAELAQAREVNQQLLKTITDNADQFLWANKTLEQQRDEARAERDRLQGLIDDLLDEPTAKQVQEMLRTWATELDWSAGCFDSVGRDEIDTIQKTLVAVIERIESIVNPEGGSDDN